jgi:hypothetical protein
LIGALIEVFQELFIAADNIQFPVDFTRLEQLSKVEEGKDGD